MRLVLTAGAKNELLRIGDAIARDHPRRALSFIEELEAGCACLTEMPRPYPLLPRHERADIRRAVHGNYLIFYQIGPDTVEVLHILHGAQDYEGILFPEL